MGQGVQAVAGWLFAPPRGAGLGRGGAERRLGLPDSHVGAVAEGLDGVP